MIAMTINEIMTAISGISGADSGIDPYATMAGDVVHDSRVVKAGDLFFAIAGETYDGHDFVADALAAGALAAVVERPMPGATIQVENTVAALGRLANAVLRRAPKLTVIAITGSSGKTTTKDMLANVLSAVGPTVSPPGSHNNELGLPMTVLSINPHTQWLILEMGARGKGHIKALCAIAPPDIGVVLNVGSAHLGEFGTVDDIAAAKAELIDALPPEGRAILNIDDPHVAAMASRTDARVIYYGSGQAASVRLKSVSLDEFARPRVVLQIGGQTAALSLKVHGEHMAHNAAAVAAAALTSGVNMRVISLGLSSATIHSPWRMEVTTTADGSIVINDAYNANPESTAAALRALAVIGSGRRTWAVLGEMRELGDSAEAAHQQIGRLAARLGVTRLVGVGTGAEPIVVGAASVGGFGAVPAFVADIDSARELLRAEFAAGDVAVIKASRVIGLERLAADLIADRGGPSGPDDPWSSA